MTPLLRKPLSRRTVLKGIGGALVALPFLDVMEARAQSAPPPPKRLVLLFSANGTVASSWVPTGGETDFGFSPILQPLEPFRSKLLILDEVDMKVAPVSPGSAHQRGIGALFTGRKLEDSNLFGFAGWSTGPSIDQEIAAQIGTTTRFGSLEVGVQVTDATVASRMSYRGPGQPLPPQVDPLALYQRVFSSFDADPVVIAARRAHRKSVLDAVQGELAAIQKKVSVDDRRKLDAHATAIRDIEQRLDAVFQPSAACHQPEAPVDPPAMGDPKNFPALSTLQTDLLAMAIICDLTRVATLQWSSGASPTVFSWLGQSELHHELSHRSDADALAQVQLADIGHWYAQQVARLVATLDAASEGEGSVLDHSLVVWGNEMGHGNDHDYASTPFVLAGSCGGHFRTGRFLRRNHESHQNLLVSCLNAFGIDQSTFGDPEFCTGPMSGLT